MRERRDTGERKQERALKLMNALSGVDERLLERSAGENRDGKRRENARGGNPLWRFGRAWAAVFSFAAVGVMAWGGYQYLENTRNAEGGVSGAGAGGSMAGAAESGTAAGGAGLEASVGAGGNGAGLTEETAGVENAGVSGGTSGEESVGETGGTAEGGTGASGGAGGGSAGMSGGTAGEKGAGASGGMDKEMGSSGGSPSQGSVPSSGVPESSPDVSGGTGNKTDGTIVDEACGLPSAPWENLTEEEAREMETGQYLPTDLPRGYSFESAAWYAENGILHAGWKNGMDYIEISISRPEGDTETVDVGLPETYDVHLYEIPYGESVPEEYREVFSNPVFAWEDMSLEIVKCRMASRQDRGDTATPRGNFAVLYSDGVLVRFTGRGSAEQIWEMFCSMGTH